MDGANEDGYVAGNSTGYLVPEEGITILSDVDDILRTVKYVLSKHEPGCCTLFSNFHTRSVGFGTQRKDYKTPLLEISSPG